jgi:hypothetical protein
MAYRLFSDVFQIISIALSSYLMTFLVEDFAANCDYDKGTTITLCLAAEKLGGMLTFWAVQ